MAETRLLHRTRVLRVEERFQQVGKIGEKDTTSVSTGWWALLDTDPKLWIYLGAFEPTGAVTIEITATFRSKEP